MKANNLYCMPGILILMAILSVGCKKIEEKSAPDPALIQCWANAFEEEADNHDPMIFRPCMTSTFPVARYRNTFTLMENGEAEYSILAPNDAHTTGKGKWSYNGQTKKLNITDGENKVVHAYEIIELTKEVLKVKE